MILFPIVFVIATLFRQLEPIPQRKKVLGFFVLAIIDAYLAGKLEALNKDNFKQVFLWPYGFWENKLFAGSIR